MIDLSTGGKALEPKKDVPVTAPSETGNDVLLDSEGKIWMQYVVFDPDPDLGYGTRGTISVTLTASDTAGFVALGIAGESGGMVGAQAILGIPKYNKGAFNYDLIGYSVTPIIHP